MNDDIAIKVDNVSKSFRLPHEKQNSIKGSLISMVRGGKRSYEKQQVLKDVSFEIKKGEFFGIVGRNGSGKSTLLKMLAGIYTPSKGQIHINGKLTPFIELGVGFNPELTGRENVFLNGALLGFNRQEMLAMYDDIVEFAELERFMDQKLKNYSSGMQVRLAFSIAIRAKSAIMLIDEVLAVGDAAFQTKCFEYFELLKKENRTIVLVSHDMSSIRRFCTEGILIDKGKIVKSGDINEVASAYAILNKPDAETTVKNGDYKVDKVELNQSDNKINLQIGYVIPQNTIKNPVIGISLLNQQGVYIVGFNNLKLKRELLKDGSKKQTQDVSIDISDLLPNDYLINVSLYSDKFDLLEHVNYAASFTVNGSPDKTIDGAYNIPIEWDT